MLQDLGDDHAVSVVVEENLGQTGQTDVEAGIEHVVGNVHQTAQEGQTKAVERVEELTEIPKYQKKPPQD